jgi:hypothetical protein
MSRRFLIIVALLVISVAGYSQSKGSIGFKAGYDQNYFIYDDLYGNNFSAFPDFNIGADASLYLNDNIRLRAELKYANVSYTREYNNPGSLDQNIEYSTLAINNLNINPFVDFKLFSIKDKFDFYYTFGMKVEFSVGDRQRSFTYGGEKIDKSFITDIHKDVMLGSGTGFILKYNVNKNLGITLSPEATIFYGEYYEKNNWHYVRSSVNVGFEWTF